MPTALKKPSATAPGPANGPTGSVQFTFSPIFRLHSRANVSVIETAQALGVSDQHVRDLIETGVFAAIPIGDDPAADRKHYKILRETVEAWWLEKYLAEQGEEFPWPNSDGIAAWRAKLKARFAMAPALRPTVNTQTT